MAEKNKWWRPSIKLSESKNTCNLKYSRTIKWLITNLYSAMNRRARNYNREIISKEDFFNWIYKQNLDKLYKWYYDSWYDKSLKPSVDRIKDSWWYTLWNIQLITWDENYKKSRLDIMKGVKKIDLKWNIVEVYQSLTEAARINWIASSCISRVCNWKRKTSLNFRWEYFDTINTL